MVSADRYIRVQALVRSFFCVLYSWVRHLTLITVSKKKCISPPMIVNVYQLIVKDIFPGRVLRYVSDGDVRSPFLGLKFAI